MIEAHFPWLTAIVLFPLIASALIPLLPDKDGKQVRWYALGVGIADFVAHVLRLLEALRPQSQHISTRRDLSLDTSVRSLLVSFRRRALIPTGTSSWISNDTFDFCSVGSRSQTPPVLFPNVIDVLSADRRVRRPRRAAAIHHVGTRTDSCLPADLDLGR